MKPKTFLILVIVLCILGAATYFVLNREKPTGQTASIMGEKPFGELPLNDIAAVRIVSVENGAIRTVGLKNEASGWTVADRFGYPADFKSISDLVEKFTELKIGRAFEATPDSVSRLSLEPPDKQDADDDAKGVRIQILAADEKSLADVVVGKERESSSGTGGQYLKPAGENTVYLVDQSFRFIEKKPEEWLKTELLNIEPNKVKSVVCAIDGQNSAVYEAARPGKEKTPQLKNTLEDRKLKNRSLDSLFDVLSSLTIKDVAGVSGEVSDEKTGFGTRPYLEYRLFDGTIYRLFPGNKVESDGEEGYYLKIEVDYEKPEPVESGETNGETASAEPAESESDAADLPEKEVASDPKIAEAKASEDAEKTDTAESETNAGKVEPEDEFNPEELTSEAKNLNVKLSKWVYVVSDWEHKSMITDPAGFYEEKETEAEPEKKTN